MSKENEKDNGEKKDADHKLTIEVKHTGLNPEKSTTPKTPTTSPTPPVKIEGIEDFQKKMKELEEAKAKEIKELTDKVAELTAQVETGKDVKKELEAKEKQLLSLATQEFEKQKKVIVDVVREQLGDEKADEVAEKITDTNKLESAKLWINYLSEAIKKDIGEGEDNEETGDGEKEDGEKDEEGGKTTPPPAGVATREPAKTGEYESVVQMIDDITATIMSTTATAQEKAKANRMLDKLFRSMVEGYRLRGKGGLPKFGGIIAKCPECGKDVIGKLGDKCPYCGATLRQLPARARREYKVT